MTNWPLIDATHPDDDPRARAMQDALHDADRGDDEPWFTGPRPAPADIRADMVADLYPVAVAAFTAPEPSDVTQASQVSAWMLAWGAPDAGRDIGRRVQRWRDAARAEAIDRLREALLNVEMRMK